MKLSGKTLHLLANFSKINQSLLFKEGSALSTVSPSKTMLVNATIDETIEKEFAIYELNRFLSVVSFLDDPEITLHDRYMTLSNGKNTVRYTYANKETIIYPSGKTPPIEPYIQFTLQPEMFATADKALKILGLNTMIICGTDGKLTLEVYNPEDLSGNSFKVEMGQTDKEFHAVFRRENMEIIPSLIYEVVLDKRGYGVFSCQEYGIRYFLAFEANDSEFE